MDKLPNNNQKMSDSDAAMNCFGVSRFVMHAVLASAIILTAVPAGGQVDSMLSPYERFEDARVNGDLAAAAEFGQRSVGAAIEEFGPESPEVVKALVRLAQVQQQLGQLKAAEQNVEQALAISVRALGEDHPDLVPLLELLAGINRDQDDIHSAAVYISRVLDIEQALYGEQSDIVLTTLGELRDIYEESGQTDKQIEIEARIASVAERTRDIGILGDDPRRYAVENGYATVRVFYGTNRAPTGNSKPGQYYGSDRGELEVGYLDVSIPETHK
jgi:tetratricopeptide (TPR) repeat protein